MLTGHEFSRACRVPGYHIRPANAPAPPAFLVAPTTCAQRAIRLYHSAGAARARAFLVDESVVGRWANHRRQSMATNAQRVIDGLDWYIHVTSNDIRAVVALDHRQEVTMGSGAIAARIDVVLEDRNELTGRVLLWDGPRFTEDSAMVASYVFAAAMQATYGTKVVRDIEIFQARRQQSVVVPFQAAFEQRRSAEAVLARSL